MSYDTHADQSNPYGPTNMSSVVSTSRPLTHLPLCVQSVAELMEFSPADALQLVATGKATFYLGDHKVKEREEI